MRILFEPRSGEWLLAAAVAAVILWDFFHKAPNASVGLRTAALLLLGVWALKPSLLILKKTSDKPRLGILLARSSSMNLRYETRTKSNSRTRWNKAVGWLNRHYPEISRRAKPRLYVYTDHAEEKSLGDIASLPSPTAAADLGPAVADALKGDPYRLWLISDGAEESMQEAPMILGHLPIPMDVLGVGESEKWRGAALWQIRLPDFAFLHAPFEIRVEWEARGMNGRTLLLRLFRNDNPLLQTPLAISSEDQVGESTFSVHPASLGTQTYRAELGGSSLEQRIEVLRQKWRIMYLAGRPSFEYASLREFLKSDPNRELVSFVILRNPENLMPFPDQDLSLIPFPAQEIFVQDISRFDLFILENFSFSKFAFPPLYLESLKSFVLRGGALLVLGGENALNGGGYRLSPLEEILPAALTSQEKDFHPGLFRPKPSSPAHPLLRWGDSAAETERRWAELPLLEGFHSLASLKPGASVLLTHPTEKTSSGQPLPILCYWRVGKGIVMLLTSPSTWRWKLWGGVDPQSSAFYFRFWNSVVQYLTGNLELKRVRWSPPPAAAYGSRTLSLQLNVFDESLRPAPLSDTSVRVQWLSPRSPLPKTLPATEESPGRYRVDLIHPEEGAHRLTAWAYARGKLIGEDHLSLKCSGPKTEYSPIRRGFLKELARKGGGTYANMEEADLREWLDKLPPLRTGQTVVAKKTLQDSPAWLYLILGLLLLEWILRRKSGYP